MTKCRCGPTFSVFATQIVFIMCMSRLLSKEKIINIFFCFKIKNLLINNLLNILNKFWLNESHFPVFFLLCDWAHHLAPIQRYHSVSSLRCCTYNSIFILCGRYKIEILITKSNNFRKDYIARSVASVCLYFVDFFGTNVILFQDPRQWTI